MPKDHTPFAAIHLWYAFLASIVGVSISLDARVTLAIPRARAPMLISIVKIRFGLMGRRILCLPHLRLCQKTLEGLQVDHGQQTLTAILLVKKWETLCLTLLTEACSARSKGGETKNLPLFTLWR